MADEDKKTEEGTGDTPAQEADSTATETKEADTTAADEAKAIREERDALKQEVQEHINARNELQSNYDKAKQQAAKDKAALDEMTPYVDLEAVSSAGASAGEEQQETFLTREQAQALETRLDQKLRTQEFIQDFRAKHPDLADKGPKEQLVTYFFTEKTLHTDPFEKRLESATNAARALLQSEQDKGATQVKEDETKAKEEADAKAKAAAQASGLSSTGITSPQSTAADETEGQTLQEYAAERKEKTERSKSPSG